MGKPRLFSTAALTAMNDPELTGLDWRVYLWVSLHDGMSLLKGKGAGCYASNLTLFAKAQCNYAAGCRSLSKLVSRGLLIRETLGRTTAYRVTFPTPDMLQAGNLSSAGHVAEAQCEPPGHVAVRLRQDADYAGEPPQDYIPLRGELDSVETGKLNSSEEARFDNAQFLPSGELSAKSLGIDLSVRGKEAAEAGLSSQWALAPYLPHNLTSLPPGAQVAKIESAFGKIGRDPERMHSRERSVFGEWLTEVAEAHNDEPFGQQAQRLSEEIMQW